MRLAVSVSVCICVCYPHVLRAWCTVPSAPLAVAKCGQCANSYVKQITKQYQAFYQLSSSLMPNKNQHTDLKTYVRI